eukprot:4931991-Pleurochrysis_carterae.AAC.1
MALDNCAELRVANLWKAPLYTKFRGAAHLSPHAALVCAFGMDQSSLPSNLYARLCRQERMSKPRRIIA